MILQTPPPNKKTSDKAAVSSLVGRKWIWTVDMSVLQRGLVLQTRLLGVGRRI